MRVGSKGRKLNKPHFRLAEGRKALIPLTKGLWATIDIGDLRQVIKHSWCVRKANTRLYAEANIKVGGEWKRVLMHRFLLRPPAGLEVDHRDGNTLNNSRSNLRTATRTQNAQNCGPDRKAGKTSRFKGVSWSKGMKKWNAQITAYGKHHQLGYYATEEEAAHAYDAAARELHGEFARANL